MKKLIVNILIFALVAALLAVTVLNAVNSSGLFSSQGDSAEYSQQSDSASARIGASFLLPEFIGAKGERVKSLGLLGNKEATAEVYAYLSPLLSAAFSGGIGEYLPAESWNMLFSAKDVVYLRYHSRLKAAMIDLHLGGSGKVKGEDPVISEIIMVLEGDGQTSTEYSVYSRDVDGTVCRFTAPDGGYSAGGQALRFDIEAFSRFEELSDNLGFDFLITANISGIPDTARMSSSQPIVSTPPSNMGLSFKSTDAELSSELLALIGFVPAGLGTYKDESGATVYINTLGTLRRHQNAMTFEAAFDGGLPISVTNTADGAYSVLESIFAVETLLGRMHDLQPELFGNEAHLMLTAAYTDGQALTLCFDYFFDNVRILTAEGDTCGITVKVDNGKVVSARADLMNANNMSYRIKSYPMYTVLRVMTPSVRPEVYSLLRLAYRTGEGDRYTEWLLEQD